MKEQFDEKLDIERNWKREQRIREMRKRKEQQNRIRKWIRAGVPVLAGIVILAVVMVVKGTGKTSGGQRGEKEAGANGGVFLLYIPSPRDPREIRMSCSALKKKNSSPH